MPRPPQAFGGRHSLQVELTLHMLGLEVCADTVVGNQMLRGISGGCVSYWRGLGRGAGCRWVGGWRSAGGVQDGQ